MIKLEVEDYCHSCEAFKPIAEEESIYPVNVMIPDTYVRCVYRKRCANMVRYLERKMKNNEHS